MRNNQRGSVVAIGLIVMMFAVVAGGGVIAWITNETKLAPMNRDALEAAYAAEAGAKRALLALADNANTDWTWVNSDRPFIDDVNNKKYNVTIPGITVARTTPAVAGAYTITSVGTVGKTKKTITVTIDVTRNSDSVFSKYAAYGGKKLILNGGTSIKGDVATNEDLNFTSSTQVVTGTAYTYADNDIPKTTDWNYNAARAYSKLTEKETLDVASLFPTMPTLSATGTNLETVSGTTLSGSYYYPTGNKTLVKSFTATGTVVIYIDGDLQITKSGTNGSITGGNDVTIYATGSILMDNNTSINVGSGSLKIYALKKFTMTNTSTLYGNQISIFAKGAIDLGSNSSINSGAPSSSITKIYSTNGSVQLTNSFKLGGTSLVVAAGSMNLNSSITLTNTILVSNGDMDVSGSVSSAGLYSNGILNVSSGTVNYGTAAQKSATLSALGLSAAGGGASSGAKFRLNSWSSK